MFRKILLSFDLIVQSSFCLFYFIWLLGFYKIGVPNDYWLQLSAAMSVTIYPIVFILNPIIFIFTHFAKRFILPRKICFITTLSIGILFFVFYPLIPLIPNLLVNFALISPIPIIIISLIITFLDLVKEF